MLIFYYLCDMEKDFIQNRNAEIQALADKLVREKTIYDLATLCAEYMLKEKERPNVRIPVTQDEYNAITSLFKIRGIRPTGELETRGRRRKDSPIIP